MLCTLLAAALTTLTPPADAHAARDYRRFIYTTTGPAGVSIRRGNTTCRTAKHVLRNYLTSDAPCEGSACVRRHDGWTCASAPWAARPPIASCTRGRRVIAAYAIAD